MLIDLHAHTRGASRCCRAQAPEILEYAKAAGLDGIALTNHYQKNYVLDGGVDALVTNYIREFEYTKRLGEEMGMVVLFGIEVTLDRHENAHVVVYGVTPDFLQKNPLLFDLTQEGLYTLVHEYGGVLIQAHPFRKGIPVLDTRFLDGIEINSHPLYQNIFSKEILEVACRERMILTSGGDFHKDTYRPICGMKLPDEITDGVALGVYLANADHTALVIQEVDREPVELEYFRNEGRYLFL